MANIALASAGSTATANVVESAGHPASAAIDGDRDTSPNGWGSGGAWSGGSGAFPAVLEIDFGQSRTFDSVKIFGLRNDVNYSGAPDTTETGAYANTAFTVDYWNGSSWVNLATETANNKVRNDYSFAAVTGTKIRLRVTAADAGRARCVEFEVYEVAGGGGTAYTMPAAVGTFALTGQAATLTKSGNYAMSAGVGSFVFTGQAVNLVKSVPTDYDIAFCHKRPLQKRLIVTASEFEPISGDAEITEDKAPVYEYSMQVLYTSDEEGETIREFLYAHRLKQAFTWYNPDTGETKTVKLMSGFDEEMMLAYGAMQIVLQDA